MGFKLIRLSDIGHYANTWGVTLEGELVAAEMSAGNAGYLQLTLASPGADFCHVQRVIMASGGLRPYGLNKASLSGINGRPVAAGSIDPRPCPPHRTVNCLCPLR